MHRRWMGSLACVFALGCAGSGQARVDRPAAVSSAASVAAVTGGPIVDRAFTLTKGALLPENMRVPAPGFDKARGWLNVTRTPNAADFAGRVVVVDFWTSCCINCIQTLPTLARIEQKHANDPFFVVGVHTQKFDAEPEPRRLRAAVIREGIHHPVAIDGDRGIWEAWDVSAWPTVLVLDAHGRIAWSSAGEPNEAELDAAVETALGEAKAEGALAKSAAAFIGHELVDEKPLAFPEKIAAVEGGLAIADGGHDRVVIVDEKGKIVDAIGGGGRGFKDGDFASARFAHPQGIAVSGSVLYVADEGNHAIRRIDRQSRTVSTIAGTGAIGHERLSGVVDATSFALRSPWDLAVVDHTLYVALAGSHQIGALDLQTSKLRLFAGTGRETRVDGPLLDAAFAQPSGLATDGKSLFVLDSETSSVRRIDLARGEVSTLLGKGLFDWGDVDGDSVLARFQHPVGLTYGNGALWVADTYNGKVKKIDLSSGEAHTVAGGTGLSEPAGLAWVGDRLVVADTNANRVVRITPNGPVELAIAPTRSIGH